MTYKPILIGGDWNAPPQLDARYRPKWIARKARLRIHHDGPGKFGNIDYCLTDADVRSIKRMGAFGSDHDLVIWTTRHDSLTLYGGTWNVLADRRPGEIADDVIRIMHHFGLDYLLLQEVSPDTEDAIRARSRYKVLGNYNPIVVAAGVQSVQTNVWQLSSKGWPVSGNRMHAPVMGSTTLIEGVLRVVSVHMPNYERSKMHNTAYRQAAKRLARRTNTRRKNRNG